VVVEGGVKEWTEGEYGTVTRAQEGLTLNVLTPPSSVKALAGGFDVLMYE